MWQNDREQSSLLRRSIIGLVASAACSVTYPADIDKVTKEDVDAAKNALDLRSYQALQDLYLQQKEADTRKAIAEAQRAEALAKLPPTESKALPGTINTEKFGAAGLVRAFDLAEELAGYVCEQTKSLQPLSLYDPVTTQGIVAARILEAEIERTTDEIKRRVDELDKVQQKDIRARAAAPLAIYGITTGIKAAADLIALFKTNVTTVSTDFGNGGKSLFATALLEKCSSEKIIGIGTGYLGELDTNEYDKLRTKVYQLIAVRKSLAENIAAVKKAADALKDGDPQKAEYNQLVATANAYSKQIDTFVESLKTQDATDKSPLFNAARYLAYSRRISGANILDVDIRLEGLAITKDGMFTGQRLRLSGVAFLTYRAYDFNGKLLKGEALRRISPPVEVNLRGNEVSTEFWNGTGR